MSKKPKVEIYKKLIEKVCCCCFQTGEVAKKNCTHCKGTGIVEDSIYYHIVKGICIDGDTVK
jgi:DnaJ-class molecular chaperone